MNPPLILYPFPLAILKRTADGAFVGDEDGGVIWATKEILDTSAVNDKTGMRVVTVSDAQTGELMVADRPEVLFGVPEIPTSRRLNFRSVMSASGEMLDYAYDQPNGTWYVR